MFLKIFSGANSATIWGNLSQGCTPLSIRKAFQTTCHVELNKATFPIQGIMTSLGILWLNSQFFLICQVYWSSDLSDFSPLYSLKSKALDRVGSLFIFINCNNCYTIYTTLWIHFPLFLHNSLDPLLKCTIIFNTGQCFSGPYFCCVYST